MSMRRSKRTIDLHIENNFTSPLNSEDVESEAAKVLEYLATHLFVDKRVVLLYDESTIAENVLERVSLDVFRMGVVLWKITNDIEIEELSPYRHSFYVYIFMFGNLESVNEFLDGIPDRAWLQFYILLFQLSGPDFTSFESFKRTPFLSYLRPIRYKNQIMFRKYTYETFNPTKKPISLGFLLENDTMDTVFSDRFWSFYGYKLHLASWADDFPYIVPGETAEDTKGISIEMLNAVAKRLNFTYQIYEFSVDYQWGDLVNDTWVGMLGEVYRDEKDIVVNVMTLDKDRIKAGDYGTYYYLDADIFLVRKPLPPPRWVSVIYPFTLSTWIAIFITVLLIPFIYLAFLKASGTDYKQMSNVMMSGVNILLRMEAFCPTTNSYVRIFLGIWMLMAGILSISYQSALIGYITVPPQPILLKTLEDVIDSDLIPVQIDYGNILLIELRTSPSPEEEQFMDSMEFLSTQAYDQGFDLVSQGTHAFVEGHEYMIYMSILYQVRDAYFVPKVTQKMLPSYTSWVFQRNTAWVHKFNRYTERFVDTGVPPYIKKVLERDFRREMNVSHVEIQKETIRPLTLADIQGAFVAYGLCIGLVILVFVGEIIWYKISTI